MEQIFSFQISPMDGAALCPQISCALEKRTELVSRKTYPKMWQLADKLNSRTENIPQSVRKSRRRRRGFLGFFDWLLSLFLLLPGLMEPRELAVPLLVGAVGFGISIVLLWCTKRTLLGILSIIKGVILCMGALGNPAELGRFLPLGIADLVIGLAALLTQKRKKTNAFDKAAQQLLQRNDASPDMKNVRVSFSNEGMTIGLEGNEDEKSLHPYSNFELILETDDLLLPFCNDTVMILQKKDLLTGTIPELREFLSAQTQYVSISTQQTAI